MGILQRTRSRNDQAHKELADATDDFAASDLDSVYRLLRAAQSATAWHQYEREDTRDNARRAGTTYRHKHAFKGCRCRNGECFTARAAAFTEGMAESRKYRQERG